MYDIYVRFSNSTVEFRTPHGDPITFHTWDSWRIRNVIDELSWIISMSERRRMMNDIRHHPVSYPYKSDLSDPGEIDAKQFDVFTLNVSELVKLMANASCDYIIDYGDDCDTIILGHDVTEVLDDGEFPNYPITLQQCGVKLIITPDAKGVVALKTEYF